MDTTCQQYMLALSEEGSITRASKKLHISQPALSNWLNSLESELGTQLVIRSKKQLIFTPAGKIYLDGCRRMLQIKQRTYNQIWGMSGQEKESITISGTPNGGARIFAAIFSSFREKYPSVSLSFLEGYNAQTLNHVAEGRADIGICSTLDLDSDVYEFRSVLEREMVLYLPSSHPLSYDASKLRIDAEFPTIKLSALSSMDFMMPSEEMSYYEGLQQLFQRSGFQPKILFKSGNVGVLYNMVKSGNGAAILPRSLFSPLDPVSPFSLKPKFFVYSTVIYKKGKVLSPAQEYLIELMSGNFSDVENR